MFLYFLVVQIDPIFTNNALQQYISFKINFISRYVSQHSCVFDMLKYYINSMIYKYKNVDVF